MDELEQWAAAQRWHDDAGHGGSCFCCCPACDPDSDVGNPHYMVAEARNPPTGERPAL